MAETMQHGIPYRVVSSALLGDDLPQNTERVVGSGGEYLRTTDAGWLARAERLGAVQRLDREPQGITKITIIEGALPTDDVNYRLEIQGGECCGEITLAEAEIFQFFKFRQKYLAAFQLLLPKMKNDEWEAIIAPLIQDAERIQDGTNDAPAVLSVINYIEEAEVVSEKKDLITGGGRRVWLDASTDTLVVLSKELEPLAEKYHIELRRLAELLKDYRAGSARRERIGGRLYHLWQFRSGLFQLRRSGEE